MPLSRTLPTQRAGSLHTVCTPFQYLFLLQEPDSENWEAPLSLIVRGSAVRYFILKPGGHEYFGDSDRLIPWVKRPERPSPISWDSRALPESPRPHQNEWPHVDSRGISAAIRPDQFFRPLRKEPTVRLALYPRKSRLYRRQLEPCQAGDEPWGAPRALNHENPW